MTNSLTSVYRRMTLTSDKCFRSMVMGGCRSTITGDFTRRGRGDDTHKDEHSFYGTDEHERITQERSDISRADNTSKEAPYRD
jgi:hypothetical protein